MQKKMLSLLLCVLLSLFVAKAQNVNVKGIIKENGVPIVGANVYVKDIDHGSVTNPSGIFQIFGITPGEHIVEITFVGYQKKISKIEVKPDMPMLEFELEKTATLLDGVEISAECIRKTEAALKLPVPLKDIPLTTSSVGAELIEQTQVNSINEALNYSTGIKPMLNYGGFQTFTMRGFGAPVIMQDGARDERMNFSNSAPVTSLAAVERIEFLKGPASVLYGHSAVGGIINIVRKQPSKDLQANFSTSYGSWESKRVNVGVGNRISNKLSYRFDVALSDQKGWRNAGDKTSNAYLALNYDLDDKNQFELRVGVNDDFYGTETGLPAVTNDIYTKEGKLLYKKGDLPTSFDRKQRYNDPADFLDHENVNASIKYTRKTSGNSKLQMQASYSDDLIDYFSTEELSYLHSENPIYDTYFLKGGEKIHISLDTLQRTYPLRFSHHTKTFQNDLYYSTQIKTGLLQHNLTMGCFFMYIDRISYKGYDFDGGDVAGAGLFAKIAVRNPVLNQGGLTTKFSGASIYHEMVNALYAQDLIEISKQFKFMLGMRFDYFNMRYQSGIVSNGRNITSKSKENEIVNKSFSYRAGVVYEPIEPLALYASYSSFFKPKRSVYDESYVYLNKDGNQFYPNDGKEVYEPENGYQAELGVKYNYNSKLFVNASAYYIKKNNIVEYLGKTGEGNKIYGQIGVVDSKGFDVETTFKPVNSISIKAGYAYNTAKYRKYSANAYHDSKQGNCIRNNPKNHVFVWAHYQVLKGALKNCSVGAGIDYTDKLYTNSSNEYSLPEYWLFNTVLGYGLDRTYLHLKINNVLNRKYYSSSVYSNQYIPGQERNVMLTVGFKL
ncbi:MAG: TonB-dependent receptor [Marinifilaceae bacterium]|nr:TonB-dependent receptor [Marinifilaceae bacterium]